MKTVRTLLVAALAVPVLAFAQTPAMPAPRRFPPPPPSRTPQHATGKSATDATATQAKSTGTQLKDTAKTEGKKQSKTGVDAAAKKTGAVGAAVAPQAPGGGWRRAWTRAWTPPPPRPASSRPASSSYPRPRRVDPGGAVLRPVPRCYAVSDGTGRRPRAGSRRDRAVADGRIGASRSGSSAPGASPTSFPRWARSSRRWPGEGATAVRVEASARRRLGQRSRGLPLRAAGVVPRPRRRGGVPGPPREPRAHAGPRAGAGPPACPAAPARRMLERLGKRALRVAGEGARRLLFVGETTLAMGRMLVGGRDSAARTWGSCSRAPARRRSPSSRS